MRSRMIETRHGKVAVLQSQSDGPPVLFIHGNSSCKEAFRHQLNYFGTNYRLIFLDLPGHGQSDDAVDPERTYTQPAYAEAALDVLDACDAPHAVVVGWSLGGHIAIEMVAKRPSLRGIAITGTPPCAPGAENVNAAFTPLPHMSFTSKLEFTREDAENYARYTCSRNRPLDPVLVAAVKRTDGRARKIMWDDWTINRNGSDQAAVIRDWNNPVAIIHGEDEPFFSLEYLLDLKIGNLWENRIHIIPDAGHAPFWEEPHLYNAILARFLADLYPEMSGVTPQA